MELTTVAAGEGKNMGTYTRRKARAWRLILGAFVVLSALVGSSRTRAPAGLPEALGADYALGAVTGSLALAALATWLIASGLPKTLGLDKGERRTRRRMWYKYAGLGLVAMIAGFALLAYSGMFAAAFLVTWLYWFGWTWISWLLADKRAVRRFGSHEPSVQPMDSRG